MHKNLLAKSVRLAMISGAAAAAFTSPVAFAAEEGAKVERIEVTGSRIKRTDMESAQPVEIVNREDLLASGLTSVGDFLNTMTIGGAAINTQSNNGGDGSTRLSMRNLGSSRVLVLVNGRRWVSDGGSVDLNTIPSTVIKRIEVLKDGAAAVYGSDAIAGVVNVITRNDFEGVEASAYYGQSAEGDGDQEQFDLSLGQVGEKGSIFFNTSYTKTSPIWAGDRDISSEPVYNTGNDFGSSGTPQGRFTFPTANNGFANYSVADDFDWTQGNPTLPTLDADGNVTAYNDFQPFSNDVRYNYAPANYMLTPQERWSSFIQGTYELADNLRISTEALYNHRESSQLLAPMPLFIGPWAGGAEALEPTVVSADNIYNPFGEDIFAEGTDSYSTGFIGRRMIENGNRIFEQSQDTWRFAVALDGEFDIGEREWSWGAHYAYGENSGKSTTTGRLNKTRIGHALSSECNADATCVPLNLFGGEGSITQDQLDYISTTEQSSSGDSITNYTANVTGSLFDLPAGEVGAAFGWEYRKESGFNSPDYMVTSGQSTGGKILPTEGSFKESSYYGEFVVPVLADMAFAELLEFEFAIRYTDLENSEGFDADNTSAKVAMQYRPTEELLVRSTWSEGFRAPTISNLFAGLSTTFPSVQDPCNNGGDGLPGCVGVPPAYTQPNSQIEGQTGSNSQLQPETSESLSAGLVYNPGWAEGFDVSIDYWDIEIEDVITRAGHQQVLDTCAGVPGEQNHPVAQYCDSILERSPSGIPSLFVNPALNLGTLATSGWDVSFNYGIETEVGDFKVAWDNTYTDNYSLTDDNGIETDNYAGQNFGDDGYPRLKSNMTLSWSYEDVSVNWKTRFISSQTEDCNGFEDYEGLCDGYTSTGTGDDEVRDYYNDYGDYYVHDLQAAYRIDTFNTRFEVGVNNIFDETPPVSVQAFANSFDVNQYDGTGRYFYGRVTVSF
ncbi:TonB-dependent receptor domain-containing protein [Shewanella sp. KT0246]|uniref:TonB-dependent receptor domain-containing protein n=1 Tax=Shewanella sp. KT0246 TaxID=2815912 RepID=UPI001BBA633B|nr:TonB-dependent receptor [Shewanella sp. KT0246]GIU02379.1 TonB-dependent receptor [Shewanella sp. KT0246]